MENEHVPSAITSSKVTSGGPKVTAKGQKQGDLRRTRRVK